MTNHQETIHMPNGWPMADTQNNEVIRKTTEQVHTQFREIVSSENTSQRGNWFFRGDTAVIPPDLRGDAEVEFSRQDD
ncbi:hypothetical protein R3X27_19470 [Tropicimonas sp. TH_r6]|uniref:hypothetical protein n=1 Tax=Tropicimonas sp. TH_r6 TaxID=3082085 RepID=UPI00295444FB|nr:hypothetical protein [Tropicimonas sp. TH_r6]MDV7144866.1 hypothetical protein [Tropicimonas sp. TH_r6]